MHSTIHKKLNYFSIFHTTETPIGYIISKMTDLSANFISKIPQRNSIKNDILKSACRKFSIHNSIHPVPLPFWILTTKSAVFPDVKLSNVTEIWRRFGETPFLHLRKSVSSKFLRKSSKFTPDYTAPIPTGR